MRNEKCRMTSHILHLFCPGRLVHGRSAYAPAVFPHAWAMHKNTADLSADTQRSPIPKPHFSSSLTRSESHRQLLVMGWGVPCGLRGRFERLFHLRSVLTELTLPFRHGFSSGTCSSAPTAPAVGSGPRLFPSPDVYIILHNRDSVNSFLSENKKKFFSKRY